MPRRFKHTSEVMDTMRNRFSHGNAQLDPELVWKTIEAGLPGRHAEVTEVSATHPHSPDHEVMQPYPTTRTLRLNPLFR